MESCWCRRVDCKGGIHCPGYPGTSCKLYYTLEEGGAFHLLRVHSVRLPDGTVWDSTINGFRDGKIVSEPELLIDAD